MIDFRYHLVSIVAVFLALAIGIVVGATQLKPATVSTLDSQSSAEKHQISSLQTANKSLQDQAGSAQQFAQAAAPLLLPGLLTGQRVVLVTGPGADATAAAGLTAALTQAGARITGEVGLQAAFFATTAATESSLTALAQQLAPAGVVPGSGGPAALASNTTIAGQLQAAQVLAPALVTQDTAGTQPALPPGEASSILGGFSGRGYLHVSPAAGASALDQATLAVVVIPSAPPAAGAGDPANLALISLAYQLRLASRGVVVAGPLAGSGPGSAIDELASGSTGVRLSSVDDADTEQGRIMVAQALSGLIAGQKPGAYGVSTGLAPAASPTPSPTARPGSGG